MLRAIATTARQAGGGSRKDRTANFVTSPSPNCATRTNKIFQEFAPASCAVENKTAFVPEHRRRMTPLGRHRSIVERRMQSGESRVPSETAGVAEPSLVVATPRHGTT